MKQISSPAPERPTPLSYRRPSIRIAALALSLYATPALAAGGSDNVALNLAKIAAPSALLSTIEQALGGPAHDVAQIDYSSAAANARAALGDLRPQVAVNLQAVADAPFTSKAKTGVTAGPGIAITLPTGKGATQLSLGAVARTEGHSQSVGAHASLSTRIPLFSGPDTRKPAAEHSLTAAEIAYKSRQRQIIVDAINAYNNAAQSEEALILATQLRQLAELDYKLGQEKYQRGSLSATELFRLRTALNSAQDGEMAAKHAYEESVAALQDLLGASGSSSQFSGLGQIQIGNTDTPSQPVNAFLQVNLPESVNGTLESVAVDQQTLDAWVALALEHRADVQHAREAVRLAEDGLRQTQVQAKRDVAFVASATWPKEVTETSVDFRTDVAAGVQATFHLANPRRSESVAVSEAALARAQANLDSLERQIRRSVPTAIHRVIEAEQAVALAQAQLKQEETALAVVRERLAQGLAVSREVAAQELAIAQQISRLHKLEGQRIVAYVSLWNTVGLDAVKLNSPTP